MHRVRLPGLASTGGHVQVTAYGTTSERCKAYQWFDDLHAFPQAPPAVPVNGDEIVEVRCFGPSSAPADARCTLTYTLAADSFLGEFSLWGADSAHVLANNPAAASYAPNPYLQSGRAENPYPFTVKRVGTGRYTQPR